MFNKTALKQSCFSFGVNGVYLQVVTINANISKKIFFYINFNVGFYAYNFILSKVSLKWLKNLPAIYICIYGKLILDYLVYVTEKRP